MTEAMKARLEELQKIAESDLTDVQKSELELLLLVEKQMKQIADQESYIGTKGTELATLKQKLEAAKPEDKAALQAQIDEQQIILKSLTNALEIAKEANEKLLKISPEPPGYKNTVDQKTVDALELKLVAIDGGEAAMDKAYESMSDDEASKFATDLPYRKSILLAALASVGSDETERLSWRRKVEDKKTPLEDENKRIQELFGNGQRNHRRLYGGGGSGGSRRDLSGQKPTERAVDNRTS